MKTLIINTASNQEISIGLKIDEKEYLVKEAIGAKRTQVVLPVIDTILTKHHLSLHDINQIEVNIGPGSYTGLRVGVAIANTLGFLLQIPINGKPVGELTDPIYT